MLVWPSPKHQPYVLESCHAGRVRRKYSHSKLCYERQNHNKALPASDDNCSIWGEGGRKGRSGRCGWKGKALAIVRTVKTNCPCAKELQRMWHSSAERDVGIFHRSWKALWVGKLWWCSVFALLPPSPPYFRAISPHMPLEPTPTYHFLWCQSSYGEKQRCLNFKILTLVFCYKSSGVPCFFVEVLCYFVFFSLGLSFHYKRAAGEPSLSPLNPLSSKPTDHTPPARSKQGQLGQSDQGRVQLTFEYL